MTTLPPVAPEAAGAALDALPPRLRRRLDGAVAALAGREVTRDGSRVRVTVDDENAVLLTLTGGIVAAGDDVVCSCLLAPACLHRAAVLASAPVADPGDTADAADADPVGAAGVPGGGDAPDPGGSGGPSEARPDEPAGDPANAPAPDTPSTTPSRAPVPSTGGIRAAAAALWDAGAAVVEQGVAGSGAVGRTALLRAAHGARLAGLPGPSGTALRVARRLTEARSADPAFRLPELTADLAALLDGVRALLDAAPGADVARWAGTARRSYRPGGTLRLHGLFTETLVTASGYAGAVAHAVAPDGTRHTVADVLPGGPERALAAAGAAVPGGCALSLRELGAGTGLLADGATVSAQGRLGGGGGIRTVRAGRTGWFDAPVTGLWERPVADQVRDVLAWWDAPDDDRRAGGDLLFLDGTLAGVAGGPGLAARGAGAPVRLHAPDEREELPYAANLRLLRDRPGLPVRLVGRLAPDRPDGVAALAVCWRGPDGEPVRVDLGLRALTRSDLPAPVAEPPAAPPAGPPAPVALDLLRRLVSRTVEGGRAVTAAAADGRLAPRLRQAGLITAAACAAALESAATERRPDTLGRLLPGDADSFARTWLAAAVYTATADRSLLLSGWPAGPDGM